jgi:hypothetical protein
MVNTNHLKVESLCALMFSAIRWEGPHSILPLSAFS